tara:strand:- start:1360 stop:2316 length:957 start_codon:yes stop_codon:yes gene_type:complete
MQSFFIKLKSFIKSSIFFIVALITRTLDNDLNIKKTLNHFFYYKKCKKLFKKESKKNISYFKEYNFNSVLGSDGFLFVRTDLSQNVAKKIFNKIKLDKDYYYDKDGQFKFSCPSQTFPELKDYLEKELDIFFKKIFKSNYKVHDIFSQYSKGDKHKTSKGSALPHTDTKPAPSVVCQFIITETNSDNAMRIVTWKETLSILFKLYYELFFFKFKNINADKHQWRTKKVNLINNLINEKKIKVLQPKDQPGGLLYFFNNNTIHYGGHLKKDGNERIVISFQIHPYHENELKKYLTHSIGRPLDKNFFVPDEYKFFSKTI